MKRQLFLFPNLIIKIGIVEDINYIPWSNSPQNQACTCVDIGTEFDFLKNVDV